MTIADLKPYPSMKDSGVPWLGDVPEHWRALPGKSCYREKKVPNMGLKETTVLSLSYGQIVFKPVDKLHGLVPASFETYQIVDAGNIIVRPTDLQNDWNSLRFGLSRHRGIITSAYMCLLTTDTMMQDYGHLLLHAYDLKKVFYGLGSGLRQNLDWRDFKYLPCVVPPLPEQATIVRFLDQADRRIRKYIRAKQKLIKLLKEQKQAIIHRAVTRSLDPNVRLKPSGVEWLGEVPEHWEVRQLKRLCRKIKTGGTPSGADEKFFEEGGFNWHTPSDFHDAITLGDASRQLSKQGVQAVITFPQDTILMIGIGATIGKVSISRKPCSCNQQINAILPNYKLVCLNYLAYYLRTLRNYILNCGKFTTMPIINQDETKRLPALLPPIHEQTEITDHIEREIKPFTESITRTEREIALIREYRTRLIADVVTGKLDVREAAVRLPDETDEPEPIDNADEPADNENGENIEEVADVE